MTDPPFDSLAEMTGVVVRALDDAQDCGITVIHQGRPVTLAYSSELAALNDESQYTLGAGPCLQALETRTEVDSPDLTAETRWGEYPPTAAGLGLRSILTLPLKGESGALNLYSLRPGGFSEGTRQAAADFAEILGRAVRAAARTDAASDSAERLQQAQRRRTDVEQAIGILRARHSVGHAEAFDMLLRSSRENDESVYDSVARIRGGFDRPEG